jgi:hypothetical protein
MTPPSILNDPQTNPTLAQPIAALAPPVRGPLPQDFLIKQDDVVTYKEIEQNLFVYSADRDWINSTAENRYQFTVNFDRGNSKQGFYTSPTATKKFKNITRIELVKAIMPTEGVEGLYTYTSTTLTLPKINVLSYPYTVVRIPELDTNNYGTDNNLDNAFAVLQYDANWYTDSTNLSDGYLGMIPKFLKCQKVYQPTPLATLQKLTFRFERPDGQLVSGIDDALNISNIFGGSDTSNVVATYTTYSSTDGASNPYFYLIQTSNWFQTYAFQPGNRIQVGGIDPTVIPYTGMSPTNFASYIQDPAGVLIAQTCYFSSFTGGVSNWVIGTNQLGYANGILIDAPLASPQTGSLSTIAFGGSNFVSSLRAANFTSGRLLNLSHQTTVVMRVITREMDPTARVRPDNL